MPGRKPTPTAIKQVEGNPGKRPLNENEPQPKGKPVKPKFLKGRASKLWDEYMPIGYWLTEADSHAFALWCGLGAEAEKDLKNMNSSRISQWRTLAAELGFLPASRSRINVGNALRTKRPGPVVTKDPAEQFFEEANTQLDNVTKPS